MGTLTWHSVEEGDLPPLYRRVIGVWDEQAMLCYRISDTQYIDELHNCYTYIAPKLWAYNPLEDKN